MVRLAFLAATVVLATTKAIVAEPILLRCTNISVRNPNPNAFFAFVTVDQDKMKIKMVTSYPDGSGSFDYDFTTADDRKISALGHDQGVERRMVLDRISGDSTVGYPSRFELMK